MCVSWALPRMQCRVLLNLRTSQPFEEVLEDLGQVLKMNGAKKMFTVGGQEVRSFSQLRNEFAEADTFYLSNNPGIPLGLAPVSPIRRSRSRVGPAAPLMAARPVEEDAITKTTTRQRARSKSRPRILYAPENELVRATGGEYFLILFYFLQGSVLNSFSPFMTADYPLIDGMKEEPTRITIKGLRRTFYPPLHHPPIDNSPPDKKLALHWV